MTIMMPDAFLTSIMKLERLISRQFQNQMLATQCFLA